MKFYRNLLILLLSINTQLHPHAFALVHIGHELPPYLFDCVHQIRLFNPHCPVYLLANKAPLITHKDDINKLRITPVIIESLKITPEHAQYKALYTKQGLWLYACERFFYLQAFMERDNITDIIHMENDNMIYVEAGELLPVLKQQYPGLAAVFINDERCIPSFVYIPCANALKPLLLSFVLHAKQGKTDMDIFALFRNKVSNSIIDALPIIPESYGRKYPLKSRSGDQTKIPKLYSKNIDLFKSVFDGNAIGQYFGGTHNKIPNPGYINDRCLFNPALCHFEWKLDAQNRWIPYMIFDNESYRINNLHIHAKRLHNFSSAQISKPR